MRWRTNTWLLEFVREHLLLLAARNAAQANQEQAREIALRQAKL